MPPVDIAQLDKKLKTGQEIPGITLYGGELYLVEECRRLLIEHFSRLEGRECEVKRISAKQTGPEDVLGVSRNLNMFAPRQVVFVQDAEAWQKGGGDSDEEEGNIPPGGRGPAKKEKSPGKILEEYFENPTPSTLLVFEAGQLDERMRLFKMLREHTLVVRCELSTNRDEDARRAEAISISQSLIPKMAQEAGVEMEAGAAAELAESLNGNLAQIRCELEKLATYVGEGKRIRVEDVETMVASARQYSVWQMAGMLAQQERDHALLFLNSVMREGEEPPQIVGAMAWMFRKILEAQELPRGMAAREAGFRLRMRENTAEIALRECRKFPRERLVAGLRALYEADSDLKSNKDERAVLEFLVTRLTA